MVACLDVARDSPHEAGHTGCVVYLERRTPAVLTSPTLTPGLLNQII